MAICLERGESVTVEGTTVVPVCGMPRGHDGEHDLEWPRKALPDILADPAVRARIAVSLEEM